VLVVAILEPVAISELRPVRNIHHNKILACLVKASLQVHPRLTLLSL
jgi:hypothetical protein